MSDNYSISITGSTIIDSTIGHAEYYTDRDTEALIQELNILQEKLEESEPLLAQTLEALESALRGGNKKSIVQITGQLSKGFAASVLSNLASSALLKFLGL